MSKIPIYFVPGLAANTKIFEYITLPQNTFELHFLDWLIPTSMNESIEEYAKRMCDNIHHENPILVGVSFGGVMAQEMSKIISTKKVIIISSIKNRNELPQLFRIAQKTKAYKLVPTRIFENFDEYKQYFIGDYLKKRAELYEKYLSVRNQLYIEWGIHNILNWQQTTNLSNVTHIHGTEDEIFPVKFIENFISVNKGTHNMILFKAKTISKLLEKECFL